MRKTAKLLGVLAGLSMIAAPTTASASGDNVVKRDATSKKARHRN